MKTVVFAYHDMGCLGIEALLSAGYEISAIFTHTDNPGEKAFYSSVARLAAERGIPVYAPDNVNHPLWVERIAQLSPEVIFSFIIAILFAMRFCSSLREVHLICMVRCYQNIVVARR